MRGVKIDPPQANFKRLVYKNAIKAKIRKPLLAILSRKPLLPTRDFGKKLELPSRLNFQTVCIYEIKR
jgi:hypothetical protein